MYLCLAQCFHAAGLRLNRRASGPLRDAAAERRERRHGNISTTSFQIRKNLFAAAADAAAAVAAAAAAAAAYCGADVCFTALLRDAGSHCSLVRY